jgi:urea transport system substrate-binding protein
MKLKTSAFVTAALLGSASALAAECADPVKVGVLHSLSGTMAISETTLKDTMLLLIDEQNAKGGVLGCQIEAVVVEPDRVYRRRFSSYSAARVTVFRLS